MSIFGNPGEAPDSGQASGAGVGVPAGVNVTAQGPQGSGQPGTTPAPTDGQDQQPGAPGEAGQGGEGQLILGKFQSPEEVYTAYSNLEKQMTRLSQENARFRAQSLVSPQPAAQPGQPAMPAQAPGQMPAAVQPASQPQALTDEALDAMWAQSPLQAINAVVAHAIESQVKPLVAPIQTVQATLARQAWAGKVDAIMANPQTYPGFDQLIPQITEIVQSNPFLLSLPDGQGLEWAYHRALGMALPGLTAGAQQMGIQAAYAGMAAKGAAQVEGGTPRQPTVQKSPDEQFLDRVFGQTGSSPVFRT